MANIIKGYDYEIQIRNFIIQNNNSNVFLWSRTPEKTLSWWLINQRKYYTNNQGHFAEVEYIKYWKKLEKLIESNNLIEI